MLNNKPARFSQLWKLEIQQKKNKKYPMETPCCECANTGTPAHRIETQILSINQSDGNTKNVLKKWIKRKGKLTGGVSE